MDKITLVNFGELNVSSFLKTSWYNGVIPLKMYTCMLAKPDPTLQQNIEI